MALIVLAVLAAAAVYLALAATVFAPADQHGAHVVHLDVHSQAVGRELGVNVVVPAETKPRGERPLLVFLHGRSGSDDTFTNDEAVYEGLAKLGRNAPVIAFPDGGVHSYWHNRREGKWGNYVMRATYARRRGPQRSQLARRPRQQLLERPLARVPALLRQRPGALLKHQAEEAPALGLVARRLCKA